MARPPLTIEAVHQAIAEFDELGREPFLRTYGFGTAKDYMLLVDGREYDSKAIVAVAHKYLPGDGRPLRSDELSGGVADAVRKLTDLNFQVVRRSDRVDWTWDEHVLALELYFLNPTSPPGKVSAEVLALSQLLQHLGDRKGIERGETYRNANGVYMKMMNFRRFDPAFQAAGKVGLSQGNKLEEEVWITFADNRGALARAAAAIRTAIDDDAVVVQEESYEAEEGGLILRLHLSRERNRALAQRKRDQARERNGLLVCEVCDFDFSTAYGELGLGFIEVHHRKPVASLKPGDRTKLEDLALVCANCHRMLHRRSALLSVEGLRAIVGQQRSRFSADAA